MSKFIITLITMVLFIFQSLCQIQIPSNESLIAAAKEGDLAGVRVMIEQGASPTGTNQYGQTALMFASNEGHKDVAEFLIQQGADVNAVDGQGNSALMDAAGGGFFPDLIKLLYEKGAKVNAINKNGDTALIIAAGSGHEETVKMLVKYKADISIKNCKGKTAFDAATEKGYASIAAFLKNQALLKVNIWQ